MLLGCSFSRDRSFYENESVTICDKPTSIYHAREIDGSPYFLNYGDTWPKNYLTVLIWERDIENLEVNPNTYFTSNDVCINGRITHYNSRPQLVLRDSEQIVSNENE